MHGDNNKLGVLGRLTTFVAARPRQTVLITVMTLVICACVAGFGLKIKSDRSDLISPEAEFHRRWLEYCDRFRETNELLILIESPEASQLSQSRDWLVEELSKREHLYTNIMVHSSLEEWKNQSEADLTERLTRLQQQYQTAQIIQHQAAQGNPLQVLLQIAAHEVQQRKQLETYDDSDLLKQLPALDLTALITGSLEQMLHSLEQDYQQYLSSKPVLDNQFWENSLKGSPTASPVAAYYRPTATDPEKAASEKVAGHKTPVIDHDQQELISIVPLSVAEPGEEKYLKNIQELNHLLKIARQRFPQAEIGVTGIPQLEHEEMARSQDDMFLASIISMIGVTLLLLFGFRGFWLPLACCLTLLCGMLWTMGFTTIAIGHLNILSMAFVTILVALGMDFCVHLLTSYQDFRQEGRSHLEAVGLAGNTVGRGIITAAVTTAIAFMSAGLTEFSGVAELGIIAGGGVLLACVATFLVFPAIVSLMGAKVDREIRLEANTKADSGIFRFLSTEWMRKAMSQQPVAVLILAGIPTLGICWVAWDRNENGWDCRVKYDANLLNMQPKHLPAVKTQERLLEGREGEVLYAVTWYNSREEAIQQAKKFRELETVGRVTELASLPLGEEISQQLEQALAFLNLAEEIPPPPVTLLPHNPAQVGWQLEQILAELKESTGIVETQLRLQLDRFLDAYAAQPFDAQIRILQGVEQGLVRVLWSGLRMNAGTLKQILSQQQEISGILLSRFHNTQGDWLVQIHPRYDVWDDAGLAAFVQDVRHVDPHVTGTPIQNYEASRQMRDSYINAAIYACIAIVLVLLFDLSRFRTVTIVWPLALALTGILIGIKLITSSGSSLQDLNVLQLSIAFVSLVVLLTLLIERTDCLISLLALIPSIIGVLMMLGFMALLGIQFTPANLVALPVVLGLGLDDGIHLIHDYRRSTARYFLSANTCRALILTTLTTEAGFGALAAASHRGLSGLGSVVAIGVGCCLFVSVIILPAVLALLSRARPAAEIPAEIPATLGFPVISSTENDSPPQRCAV